MELHDDYFQEEMADGHVQVEATAVTFPAQVRVPVSQTLHPVTHEAKVNLLIEGLNPASQPQNLYNQQQTAHKAHARATLTIGDIPHENFKLHPDTPRQLAQPFATLAQDITLRVKDDTFVYPCTGARVPLYPYGAVVNPRTACVEPWWCRIMGGTARPTVRLLSPADLQRLGLQPGVNNNEYVFMEEASAALSLPTLLPTLCVVSTQLLSVVGHYTFHQAEPVSPDRINLTFNFNQLKESNQ